MGRRTSYTPGTFSWVDLATADAGAAKSFYTRLFGWKIEDTDAGDGDGDVYTICRLNGDAVCGLFGMSADMRAVGVAPNWTSYVTVADVDAAAARATRLGGDVINDVFDVQDVGRMAVLKDPQGAVLALWQPGTRIGAERGNDVGCLCMNELVTTDIDAARSFYEGLFGWTTEAWDTGPDGPQWCSRRTAKPSTRALPRCNGTNRRAGAPASPSSRPTRLSSECANSGAAFSPSRSRSPMGASRSYSIRRAFCSRSSRGTWIHDRAHCPKLRFGPGIFMRKVAVTRSTREPPMRRAQRVIWSDCGIRSSSATSWAVIGRGTESITSRLRSAD
jgi:predicted enzyme related to lactoylglutathione lyase